MARLEALLLRLVLLLLPPLGRAAADRAPKSASSNPVEKMITNYPKYVAGVNKRYETYLKERGRHYKGLPPDHKSVPAPAGGSNNRQAYRNYRNRLMQTDLQFDPFQEGTCGAARAFLIHPRVPFPQGEFLSELPLLPLLSG